MPYSPIINVAWAGDVARDLEGLFPGRPWLVYYVDALKEDGRRAKRGIHSFETQAEAQAWRDLVALDRGLPF